MLKLTKLILLKMKMWFSHENESVEFEIKMFFSKEFLVSPYKKQYICTLPETVISKKIWKQYEHGY